MKTFRLWLLLLLAVLLPLRGGFAATVLCPMTGSVAPWALHEQASDPLGQQGTDDGMAGHEMAAHASHGEAHHHGHAGATDKCSTCSAFCSLTPLASQAPRLAVPAKSPTHVFPPLSAPAPTFLSDGQERPPRSI